MWAAIVFLAIASPFLFMLVVYVIQRWTATGASYQFVLFPIVSVIGGALLLGEDVTSSLLLGRPRAPRRLRRSAVRARHQRGRRPHRRRTATAEPLSPLDLG